MRLNLSVTGLPLAEASITRLLAKVQDQPRATRIAAAAVRQTLTKHLVAKNAQPNKRGWPKTNFYAQTAKSIVELTPAPTHHIVQINDPRLIFRYHGGILTPKRSKLLAIPLRPEYAQTRPRTHKLIFIPAAPEKGRKHALLARKGQGKTIIPAYVLVKQVRQSADPTVLPTPAAIETAALKAIQRLITIT